VRRVLSAWLAVPALLLSGCLDPALPTAEDFAVPSEEPPRSPQVFRIVVVTDEYFPIPGAAVFVVALDVNLTVNATGGASIGGIVPGPYDVVVSRDGFKTNRTTIEATYNQTEALPIQLEKVPRLHPHLGWQPMRGTGVCSVYRADPVLHDRECRDDPDPNYTPIVRLDLPANLTMVNINVTWSPGTLARAKQLRFEVRVFDGEDAMAFTDGRTVLSIEGASGVSLAIGPDLIPPAMRAHNDTLELRAFPSEHPEDSAIYSQQFEVFANAWFLLPPSP